MLAPSSVRAGYRIRLACVRGPTQRSGLFAMSASGQNRKSSMRAYVVRCSPNNGHRQDTSACPFRAIRDILHGRIQHVIQLCGRRWHRGPYPRPIAEVSSGSAINITSEVIDHGPHRQCAPRNPLIGPRWSGSMQRDWSRTQSAKLNPSYSLTKACVSPKHYFESCSQSDAKHEARYS